METSQEDIAPPYIMVDAQTTWMRIGESLIDSYSLQGDYAVEDDRVIVDTQDARFVFVIEDHNTLILSEHNSMLDLPEHARFVYNEAWSRY